MKLFYLLTGFIICISSWIAYEQWQCNNEVQAAIVLRTEYHVLLSGSHNYQATKSPCMDISQLQYGRLYVPISAIYISNMQIDENIWGQLTKFKYLDSLWLIECKINPDIEFKLSKYKYLKKLYLDGTPFSLKNLRSLSERSRLEELYNLEIDKQNNSTNWIKYLCKLNQLKVLSLPNTDLSDEEYEQLSSMKELMYLDLNGSLITPKKAGFLSELKKLCVLYLPNTNIDDKGLEKLISLSCIDSLDLSGTHITDDGMPLLAKFPKLGLLYLSKTNISDKGLSYLAGLKNLETLDLSGTHVTNDSIRILAAIPSLTFNGLNVENTQIDQSGLEQLQKVLK